jgi:hypothetical protein
MRQLGYYALFLLLVLSCQTTDHSANNANNPSRSQCRRSHVELDLAELSGNGVMNPDESSPANSECERSDSSENALFIE